MRKLRISFHTPTQLLFTCLKHPSVFHLVIAEDGQIRLHTFSRDGGIAYSVCTGQPQGAADIR
jgi:hypothetical protein